jgi:hypothetical protein
VNVRPPVSVPRSASFVALLLLGPMGLGTKRYHGPAETWVHASAGDILNATFWLFLLLLIWPKASLWKAGAVVFLYCTAVEFSQLLHTPWLDAARRTLPGRLILGSEFDGADIGCYAVGTALGMGIAAVFRRSTEGRAK